MHHATRDGDSILLSCEGQNTLARILPLAGNTLCGFSVQGNEWIFFPDTPEEYAFHNKLAGNPLMHPWSNRLEGDFFWWQGKRYELDTAAIPMRDGNYLPLHGLLYKSPRWNTTRLEANEAYALHEAQLDFAAHHDYLSLFPFAHTLILRHWLERNTLTVELVIRNTGEHDMPVSCGFHPYFSYAGHARKGVQVALPVTERFITDELLLPTGEKAPVGFAPGELFPLDEWSFDDGFTGILPGSDFVLQYPDQTLRVHFGDTFPVAVVYAPHQAEKPYVCFEPMAAPTNALQLDHYGRYKVPVLAPGKEWNGWWSMRVGG